MPIEAAVGDRNPGCIERSRAGLALVAKGVNIGGTPAQAETCEFRGSKRADVGVIAFVIPSERPAWFMAVRLWLSGGLGFAFRIR